MIRLEIFQLGDNNLISLPDSLSMSFTSFVTRRLCFFLKYHLAISSYIILHHLASFNTKNGWVTAPDHYITGLVLILAGGIGLQNSKGALGKALSAILARIGTYLVLDDIKDLEADIRKYFENVKGDQP